MMDFLERMRAKPENVRRRFAFAAASGVTGVVAVGWGIALVAGGTLAINASPSAVTSAPGVSSASNAAAAFVGAWDTVTGKQPAISVVETHASSTLDEKPKEERTVIPF